MTATWAIKISICYILVCQIDIFKNFIFNKIRGFVVDCGLILNKKELEDIAEACQAVHDILLDQANNLKESIVEDQKIQTIKHGIMN